MLSVKGRRGGSLPQRPVCFGRHVGRPCPQSACQTVMGGGSFSMWRRLRPGPESFQNAMGFFFFAKKNPKSKKSSALSRSVSKTDNFEGAGIYLVAIERFIWVGLRPGKKYGNLERYRGKELQLKSAGQGSPSPGRVTCPSRYFHQQEETALGASPNFREWCRLLGDDSGGGEGRGGRGGAFTPEAILRLADAFARGLFWEKLEGDAKG